MAEAEPEPMDTSEYEVQIALSVKWSEGSQPPKSKNELQKALQTWANHNNWKSDITVTEVMADGRAVLTIQPNKDATLPDVRKLQELSGKTLNRKDQTATVTVTAVSLTLPEKDANIPDNVSMNAKSDLQQVQQQPVEQSGLSPSAAVSTPEEVCSGTIPVSHWWYMNHIYKEDIVRIEKENEIKMTAEVNVKFEGDQKDGGPQKALSAFINLAQQCITESQSPSTPLRHVAHQGLLETLKIIQRPENKILLTVSSDGVTVCGPSQSQEAVRKSLNAAQKTTTNAFPSAGESTWMAQNTSPNIGMQIEDPIVNAGLTMEKSSWKMIMSSFDEQVSKIKTKFGVHFAEFDIGQDKVQVKALSKGSGGNKSMESHATRALLQLYQKIVLSPKSFTQIYGATGFSGSQKVSWGDLSKPVLNGQTTGEGAAAGGNKDEETCPICMDTFTNKKQLTCKHEFCEKCLDQSKESIGSVCPVCKNVFGKIEGDQPDGKMSHNVTALPLPGFPNCGTIVISYDIPSGKQTEKHPNPGEYYSGVRRTAYLPDNKEGKEVLALLKRAFDQKLIFTVGTSRTTGMDNQVTWNDIHHKTSTTGGQVSFGYPDPNYLSRVREELKAKGIE